MADYDIGAAFEAIEDELIASMIRNMDRHRAWEDDEGIQWSMWQAEQLKALEKYKKANQKRYGKQFKNINGQIGEILYKARQNGNMQQEIQILNAIKNGFTGVNKVTQGTAAEFFRLNDRKLEALIEATTNDMERAETAILRKANDEYRKVIYNAQVYANTGAGTYEKAVDMATKDMLSRGLACVEYANGARHTLADYADMAIRTASKRAYLQGEGEKRQEWGIATVIMVKRGNPCPKCLPFVGKVLIDDVWSGGQKSDGPYPLMSKAIAAGLYHPRCKDSHTTYFPGISTADDSWSKEELEAVGQVNKQEVERQYAKRQTERFERLADRSLDEENQKKYAARREEWKKRQAKAKIPEIAEKKEIEYDFKGKDEMFRDSRELIDKLSAEYNTHLENVTIGARHAAGTVDMSGTTMHLSSADPAVAIHEFAHSMTNSKATQYGVAHDDDFWKEIKAVRRRYHKDAGDDTNRWISSYEHSQKEADEFFAEAFTQAKMREMGLELPGKYGTDTTYSQQVLEITNRYFGKVEQEFSPRKATKGSFGVDWPKVMSPEYRKSLEKLSGDKKVVDAIEVRAKWALSNRNGMKTEELYAVSLDTGKEITSILGQQVESGVNRTKSFIRRLNEADARKEKILLIHNHPQGLPPSINDINALMSNKNVSGITVGHNGSIYYYTKPVKAIPQFDFDVALRRYKEYTDVTGMEKALESLQSEYGFTIKKL